MSGALVQGRGASLLANAWAVLKREESPEYRDAFLHAAGGFYPTERPRRDDDPIDCGPGPMVRVMARKPLPVGEGRAVALREARARRLAAEAALAPAEPEAVERWLKMLAVGTKGAPRNAPGDAALDAAVAGHVMWLLDVWKLPAICFTPETLGDASTANPQGFWPAPVELREALEARAGRMRQMLEQANKAEAALLAADNGKGAA